jgi:nitrogen fixation NifU-like protein
MRVDEPVYTRMVIEHYRRPRNRGRLTDPDRAARVRSRACGDELRATLALDGDRIAQVRFEGDGCAISQAAASIASDRYPGMLIEDVLALGESWAVDILGGEVTPRRRTCATLNLVAVQKALRDSAGAGLRPVG